MALYLSIPWYLYADDPYFATPGARNHAHIAFRRLLLWMLLCTDMPELDIPLNTEEPRITPIFDGSVKPSRKSEHRALTGNEMSAHQVEENVAVTEKPPSPEIAGHRLRGQQGRDRHRKGSSIAPAKGTGRAPSVKHIKSTSHTSTSSRKRARDETDADSDSHDDDSQGDDDDAPARKKRAVLLSGDDTDSSDNDDLPAPASVEEPMVLDPTTPTDSSSSVDEPAASVDESTASANAVTATDEPKGVKQRPLDPKIQRYVAKIHAGQQTVNALRLKIWKDKTLWFGRGD
ncbi:hypothetical protein EXIGLDRAFT_339362 [Exidia glandulosa HHB12029]|uniref:Uncharacterized protein n=1 Tax=Exidia glandulosa HHB12029 TaxID=1314781 RepID=A0A165CJX0_EXIGL|nr:hypothetical protein EXIGLDRAFT_339362 [Exidia glandulosa HHB12029]